MFSINISCLPEETNEQWAMAWIFHDLASVWTRISVIGEHMGTQYERGKRWKTDFYDIYDGGTWSSVITSKHLPTPFSLTFACFWCGWCSRAPGTNIASKCSKATFRDQTSQRTGWKHQSCTTQDELQIARWAEQSVDSSYPQENRHNLANFRQKTNAGAERATVELMRHFLVEPLRVLQDLQIDMHSFLLFYDLHEENRSKMMCGSFQAGRDLDWSWTGDDWPHFMNQIIEPWQAMANIRMKMINAYKCGMKHLTPTLVLGHCCKEANEIGIFFQSIFGDILEDVLRKVILFSWFQEASFYLTFY